MRVCRKCLLEELEGMTDVIAMVEKTRELLPESEKCSEEEYRERLSRCLACDDLLQATCQKCGCYVEIRALRKDAHCPRPKSTRAW